VVEHGASTAHPYAVPAAAYGAPRSTPARGDAVAGHEFRPNVPGRGVAWCSAAPAQHTPEASPSRFRDGPLPAHRPRACPLYGAHYGMRVRGHRRRSEAHPEPPFGSAGCLMLSTTAARAAPRTDYYDGPRDTGSQAARR
jgi:hypothetical protein